MNKLVPISKRWGTIVAPAATPAERAEALLDLALRAAEQTVGREPTDAIDPDEDTLIHHSRVAVEAHRILGAWTEASQIAQTQLEIEMVNGGFGWLNRGEEYRALYEILRHEMPDDEARRRSGRARQKAKWVEQSTRTLIEAGISPLEIAEAMHDASSSMLGIASSAITKVEQNYDLGQNQRVEAYYQILDEMRTLPVREFAHEHQQARVPPVELGTRRDPGYGAQFMVILAKTEDQVQGVLNRLRGFYVWVEDVYPPITAGQVLTQDARTVARIIELQNPLKLALYRVLSTSHPRPMDRAELARIVKAEPSQVSIALNEMLRNGVLDNERRGTELIWKLPE